MKIILAGGSGQLGTLMARAFSARGDEVVVLSRTVSSAPWRVVAWDAMTAGAWHREIDGADVVMNLAGRSVDCRYTEKNRRLILDSRIGSTRAVGQAIAAAKMPPRVWLQMSTATIYAHRLDAPNDELTGIIGGGEASAPDTWRFSIDVARAWEAELDAALTPSTRKVKLRSSMVMNADRGSIFDVLLRLVRLGLGGPVAGGKQYVSWIHQDDFIRAIEWILGDETLSGAVNVCSPQPLPYSDFMRGLRDAWGTRIALPATRWMLELGAIVMRTETELVLKSRRVIPTRLLQSGFTFDHPQWPEAARDLVDRRRLLNLAPGFIP